MRGIVELPEPCMLTYREWGDRGGINKPFKDIVCLMCAFWVKQRAFEQLFNHHPVA
jgi:hypothetical protein